MTIGSLSDAELMTTGSLSDDELMTTGSLSEKCVFFFTLCTVLASDFTLTLPPSFFLVLFGGWSACTFLTSLLFALFALLLTDLFLMFTGEEGGVDAGEALGEDADGVPSEMASTFCS